MKNQQRSIGVQDAVSGLLRVEEEIVRACKAAGRQREDVTLIAVSKTHHDAEIVPVIEAGHKVFGENRVQETQKKWPLLRERFPDVRVHLIGMLQSNKAREAVQMFDVIHTLDRVSLAEVLAREMERAGRAVPVFVQVNTGEEAQKTGVVPQEADGFIDLCRKVYALPVAGVMCLPPVDQAPAPHFALSADIAARNGLTQLSMGMSSDFATAIRFGATHVRVGSAIFGERQPM